MIELIKRLVNYLGCLHIARLKFVIRNLEFLIVVVANCKGRVFTCNIGSYLDYVNTCRTLLDQVSLYLTPYLCYLQRVLNHLDNRD